MKKLLPVLLILLALTACGKQSETFTFTAVVESMDGGRILVTATDNPSFDKAYVGMDKGAPLPEGLAPGQVVEIEALPEIRESYPVQITAVKIKVVSTVENASILPAK